MLNGLGGREPFTVIEAKAMQNLFFWEMVEEAIENPKDRQVFDYTLQGLNKQEIARKTGYPVHRIDNALKRMERAAKHYLRS